MFSKAAAVLLVLGHLVAMAFSVSIPSGSLSLSNSPNASLALPSNATLSERRRPQDPLEIPLPHTGYTLRFYDYGVSIPEDATDRAIDAAYNFCNFQSAGRQMPKYQQKYPAAQFQPVNLKVTSNSMTWGDWFSVIVELKEFVSDFESFVVKFKVVQGGGTIGYGYLEDNSEDTDSDAVASS